MANPALDLGEKTRSLMRLLPNSVVVCTSTAPASSPELDPIPRAMTASSLTSVSLGTPAAVPGGEQAERPVVSFNIKAPSQTLAAIQATRRFNIHVLSGDAGCAAVAHWFTQPQHSLDGKSGTNAFNSVTRETRCTVASVDSGDVEAAPVLQGHAISFVIRCQLLGDEHEEAGQGEQALPQPSGGLVRVRDHVVVFGEVFDVLEGSRPSDERDKKWTQTFGLAYADRRYRQLGNTIVHWRDLPDNSQGRRRAVIRRLPTDRRGKPEPAT